MFNLPEESGYVAGHENKAFSIITCLSVKTTLKSMLLGRVFAGNFCFQLTQIYM